MPFIEKDALNNAEFGYADAAQFTHTHDHDHAPLKSFIATPRVDNRIWNKFRSLFKSEMKPGQTIVRAKDGLRYMFIITSNSYEDRDDETITSKALEAYENSCYPGEGLFHCDNPLVWWHDDDVPMGEIVAVNYSTPFLIEVAKELPSPIARVLWDYAEQNGDNAGASHRFGYRDEDRKPDGSYTHIIKQETSYLPERVLAANLMTYAGVIDKTMSNPQSDARLTDIFAQATGGKIKNAAEMIHAKSGELAKELAALGITHKASKAENPAAPEEEIAAEDAALAAAEDMPEEKAGVSLADIRAYLGKVDRVIAMMEEMTGAQASMLDDMEGMQETELALAKEIKSLKDEKVAAKSYTDSLEQRVKMLEDRARLSQRRASQTVETDPDVVKASIDEAIKSAAEGELVDSFLGKIKPPIKYNT
jgi:hypothetical protein